MKRKAERLLTQGPLPKSVYTVLLEQLTRNMMQTDAFDIEKRGDDDYIIFENGNEYNWSEIRENANLDHIEFDEYDFDMYAKYIASEVPEEFDPTLEASELDEYRNKLYEESYDRIKRERPNPQISFEEMQAINVYSSRAYRKINALLRGKLDLNKKKSSTRAALIQAVMCASGLRKIPETTIRKTHRGVRSSSPSEQQRVLIEAAKHKGVIPLSGFVSSSAGEVKSDFSEASVHFHFTNVRGIYIEPISRSEWEEEFLIPPTQVQITAHREVDGVHHFKATLVSDLESVPKKSLENPACIWISRRTDLKEEIKRQQLALDSHFKKKPISGMRKNELIQKGLENILLLIANGSEKEALIVITQLKKDLERQFGKNNFFKKKSHIFDIVEKLEMRMKLDCVPIQNYRAAMQKGRESENKEDESSLTDPRSPKL